MIVNYMRFGSSKNLRLKLLSHNCSWIFRRHLHVAANVRHALEQKKKPVISLESTIITHGLPYPDNLHMAREVEMSIIKNGGVPATCGFVHGEPFVGLNSEQIHYLAEESARQKMNKVSRRDIGYTMTNKLNGGTTIASTVILSHMAGIKVFATGGLGGVHKEGQTTMDISADLRELGRTPVSVVCAGPKSILDIGLTMEYLETEGVFVGTYNDQTRSPIQVPGFYCRESGIFSPYEFTSFQEAAAIIHNQNNLMKLKSGNVFCVPPPPSVELSSSFINDTIQEALLEAQAKRISGKEITPFLLGAIAKKTGGKSVECNVKFVINNAIFATNIAKELLKLETPNETHKNRSDEKTYPKNNSLSSKSQDRVEESAVDTLVVGGIALDYSAEFKHDIVEKDSNPGKIKSSPGGVGFNVAFAHSLSLLSPSCNYNYRPQLNSALVAVVADDFAGQALMQALGTNGVSGERILKVEKDEYSTAQYMSLHTKGGDLVLACADMDINESPKFHDHIMSQLENARPKQIILDCNMPPSTIADVIRFIKTNLPTCRIIIEPTSAPKAKKLSGIKLEVLGVYPNNGVSLITPTVLEVDALFESFQSSAKFDDFENWFPMVDSLGLDNPFRQYLEKSHYVFKEGLEEGFLQKCFRLLPYFNNILLKLGSKGIMRLAISSDAESSASLVSNSTFQPTCRVTSKGKMYLDQNNTHKRIGIVIEYFKPPKVLERDSIKNVTGCGDSFLGYFSAKLAVAQNICENSLPSSQDSLESQQIIWEAIYKGQLASQLSLQDKNAVSQDIRNL